MFRPQPFRPSPPHLNSLPFPARSARRQPGRGAAPRASGPERVTARRGLMTTACGQRRARKAPALGDFEAPPGPMTSPRGAGASGGGVAPRLPPPPRASGPEGVTAWPARARRRGLPAAPPPALGECVCVCGARGRCFGPAGRVCVPRPRGLPGVWVRLALAPTYGGKFPSLAPNSGELPVLEPFQHRISSDVLESRFVGTFSVLRRCRPGAQPPHSSAAAPTGSHLRPDPGPTRPVRTPSSRDTTSDPGSAGGGFTLGLGLGSTHSRSESSTLLTPKQPSATGLLWRFRSASYMERSPRGSPSPAPTARAAQRPQPTGATPISVSSPVTLVFSSAAVSFCFLLP
nr:collagen alpha-1(I) chain-like [Vulpes vulpes]